jgi:putative selenium metabolism hydrolase
MEGELVEFARSLLEIPSQSLEEGRVAKAVAKGMRKLGYDEVFLDDAGNVVGVIMGRQRGTTVLLNAHMDTVAPRADEKWILSPYESCLRNGRLYGLGAADCKGGLASQVYAGALLKHSLLPMDGNLVVAATVAEENGRTVGGRHLLEKTLPERGLRPDWAVIGEPTDLGMYYGHDGWMELDVHVEGPVPCDVHEAAYSLLDFFRSTLSHDASLRSEQLSVHRLRFEDMSATPSAVIPLARRLGEGEVAEDVLGLVRQVTAFATRGNRSVALDVGVREEQQRLYTGATTRVKHVTPAWSTDPFHLFLTKARQALNSAGRDSTPGKWKLDRLGMGTAGSVFVNEFNLPTLGFGPGGETEAHSTNEFVEIDHLIEAAFGTAVIAHALIGVPVFGWSSEEI